MNDSGSSFDLPALRREFPILSRRTYLNSCSLGALSHRAEDRLDTFREEWHTHGASAWYEIWLDRIEELRTRAADFMGVPSRELAILPSTSAALSMVAESLPSRPGRHRVVTTELDFPTILYQWRVKPEMEVVVLPSSDGVGIDLDQYREAVDDRTAVVATSHVFFATGFVQDAAAIAGIARDAGAVSVIDGYQSVGQIPVDVESVGADAYTTGPLKWLCGGPGLSYLRVRPERIAEWEPRITSWFAAADQFDFDPHDFRFRDDARRFELGTPPLPTIHTSLGGQEILSEVGIERVAARNRALTERVVGGCRDAGFDLRIADEPRRSAIVMIRHPDPPGAVDALDRDGIIVDHRPGHVRVSPHVYNTDDEIDRFVEALARTR